MDQLPSTAFQPATASQRRQRMARRVGRSSMLTEERKLHFLLLFFASFLPPDVSQNWWTSRILSLLLLASFLSPLKKILDSLLFSSPLFLMVKLSTGELEKERIKILLFFLSSPPLLPLSSSPVLSLATKISSFPLPLSQNNFFLVLFLLINGS